MAAECKTLNSFQMVVGCDFHKQIPPPPPAGPLPMAPHLVAACIGQGARSGSKASATVKSGWGYALGRHHDLGAGPYHLATNLLLPLVWMGAGNKAEFASGTVFVDVHGSAARMAVAAIPVVGLNPQLDCNEPAALPTSTCVASFNTVSAGFTAADCVGGFAGMLADISTGWITSKLAGTGVNKAGAALARLLGRAAVGPLVVLAARAAAGRFPSTATAVRAICGTVLGWLGGASIDQALAGAGSALPGLRAVHSDGLSNVVNDLVSDGLRGK